MRAALVGSVGSAAGAGLHAAVGVAMLAGLATSMAADRLPYSVRWRADPDFPKNTIVEVSGVEQETLRALQRDDWPSAGWGKVLSVFAGRENRPADPAMPAMLGQYTVAMDDVSGSIPPAVSSRTGRQLPRGLPPGSSAGETRRRSR